MSAFDQQRTLSDGRCPGTRPGHDDREGCPEPAAISNPGWSGNPLECGCIVWHQYDLSGDAALDQEFVGLPRL